MDEAIRYRSKAAELRAMAERADNVDIRDELAELARQYDEMARAREVVAARTKPS
jgi:hypothetical protein